MRIQHLTNYNVICEDCLKEYPDSPSEATMMIDRRYLCDVHADEEINRDLYEEIDEEYKNLDEEE